MKKKKLCFVIYNRSNYARLKPILQEIARQKKIFELIIILTSSSVLKKHGELKSIIEKDGLKVNYYFFSHIEGENNLTMTKSVSVIISELSSAFDRLKPDIVITIGDRYETIATGICASYMNIYLIHIQGGELTSSIDEKIRHAITKLSNLHLVCTAKAKKLVIQMGEKPQNVKNVGCTSIDLIKKINFKKKVDLKKYKFGVGRPIDTNEKYIVALLHPNTLDYKENLSLIRNTFQAINKLRLNTIWIWPNIDAGSDIISKYLRAQREKNKDLKINFYINFEPEDYLKLLKKSLCLVGNSSSGIRECSYLAVPFVNIGNRQYLRERGENTIDVTPNKTEIIKGISNAIYMSKKIKSNKIYGNGQSTKKIINILKKIKTNIHKNFYEI